MLVSDLDWSVGRFAWWVVYVILDSADRSKKYQAKTREPLSVRMGRHTPLDPAIV
jgi:hypothetical protein